MGVVASEKQSVQVLDKLYTYCLNGLPGQETVYEIGNEYMEKYKDPKLAANKFVKNQIAKCTTSGFLLNVGGMITLPFTIPANISSVLYIQLRMIATLAYMGGMNPKSDHVQTLCYVALTGTGATDILKKAGISFGRRFTNNMISKISGKTLTMINQKVGMRLLTKFGEKGIVNLGKTIPFVGGFVGGGFDYVTTNTIAKTAIQMFIA